MASLNRAEIIGHLGQDPEVRYTQSGDAVATLSIATTEKWKDKQSGEVKESTEWHRVSLWRRLGEVAGEHLSKGALVYISGKLKTRKWTDKEGIERYTTEIIGSELVMLSRKEGTKKSDDGGAAYRAASEGSSRSAGGFEEMDDDIPF